MKKFCFAFLLSLVGFASATPFESFEMLSKKMAECSDAHIEKDKIEMCKNFPNELAQFIKSYEKTEPRLVAYLGLQDSYAKENWVKAYEYAFTLYTLEKNEKEKQTYRKALTEIAYQKQSYTDAINYGLEWLNHNSVKPIDNVLEEERRLKSKEGTTQKANKDSEAKKVISVDPMASYKERSRVLTIVAFAAQSAKNDELALKSAREAFAVYPTKDASNFYLYELAKAKLIDEEIRVLPIMVRYWQEPLHWERWGILVHNKGQKKKALNIWGAAYAANKLRKELYPFWIGGLIEEDAASKALTVLKKEKDNIKPENYKSLFIAAAIKSGEKDEVVKFLSEYLGSEISKNDKEESLIRDREIKAQLNFGLEKWKEALADFTWLEANDSKRKEDWKLMCGMSAFETGDLKLAKSWFEKITDKKWKDAKNAWISEIEYLLTPLPKRVKKDF